MHNDSFYWSTLALSIEEMSKVTASAGSLIHWLLFLLLCCSPAWPADNVKIEGIDSAVAENVRLHLPALDERALSDREWLRKRLLPPASRALQALGYYKANIEIHYDQDTPILQIEPGAPVTWGDARIGIEAGQHDPDPALEAFARNHPFTPDKAINHGAYNDFKRELLALAQRLGYLDASMTRHLLLIDLRRERADVELELSTGAAFSIGAIHFSGSDLEPRLLQRLSGINVGERYDANRIGELHNRLFNSGYFAAVTVDRQPQRENKVALNVQLQDAAPHRYSAGVGYGTDTGPRVKLGWQRPRVNSRGDSVRTQLELSEIGQELTLQYRIPWRHPLERYLSWQNGWQRKDVEDTETKILSTGIAYHRVVSDGWQYSFQVDLERETYTQGAQPQETVTYVLPGTSWSRSLIGGEGRDPEWGLKFWFGLQASNETLGSDTDFLRLTVGGRLLKRLGENNQVIARASGGAIYSGEFFDVPASRRFFTGGDQTVRGFDFESLSPLDSQGELTGGQYLNTASLEFRRRWRPHWQWALFADTGRAYNDSSESFHTGAGVGLRWLSPLGTVAIDLAKPVDSDRSDSVRLHLYMGLPL